MNNYMTIDQVLSSAKSDIDNKIKKNEFRGWDPLESGDDENFYSITAMYVQWALSPDEAETALYEMYEELYPNFIEP